MDTIIINKIAPLCPFLYITLRAVCKKYRERLPLAFVEQFLLWSKQYQIRFLMADFRQLIHAIIPWTREPQQSDMRASGTYEHGKSCYLFHFNRFERVREDLLGKMDPRDWYEYTCEHYGCQLGCKGPVWFGVYGHMAKSWVMSFEPVSRRYVLKGH